MNGYAKIWFFSESTSGLNTFLVVSNYLSGLGCFEFTNRFLRADSLGRFWSAFFRWGVWLFVGLAGLSFVLPYSLMIIGVVAWGTFLPAILVWIGIRAVIQEAGAFYFLLAWLGVLVSSVVLSLGTSAVLPANSITLYSLQIASALQVMLLSLAIGERFRIAQEERDASQVALLESYNQLDEELLKRERLLDANAQLTEDNRLASEQLIQADKLATLGTMVAGVAHDIANPTSLIALSREQATETLQANIALIDACFGGVDDEETLKVYQALQSYHGQLRDALGRVELGTTQIAAINSAIRNQSRSDQKPTQEALNLLVRECLVIVSNRLKGIEVDVDISDDFSLELIRSQFGQVLMNLLANAADAVNERLLGEPGGRILIQAMKNDDGTFLVSIEDNGPGFQQSYVQRF